MVPLDKVTSSGVVDDVVPKTVEVDAVTGGTGESMGGGEA